MNAPKFTHGTWRTLLRGISIDGGPDRNDITEVFSDEGILWIAYVQRPEDARLIAAAPEMLEALKGVADEMELADFDPEDQDTWYGRALAIIAKAEGRSL